MPERLPVEKQNTNKLLSYNNRNHPNGRGSLLVAVRSINSLGNPQDSTPCTDRRGLMFTLLSTANA